MTSRLSELPPLEWFQARIMRVDENGCWLWRGPVQRDSTGQLRAGRISYKGEREMSYRALYRLIKGDFPNDMDLDHLCRVPRCVNPDHLEPVTRQENVLRSPFRGAKTHCDHGHEFTDENTLRQRKPSGTIQRYCRTCYLARQNARYRLRTAS